MPSGVCYGKVIGPSPFRNASFLFSGSNERTSFAGCRTEHCKWNRKENRYDTHTENALLGFAPGAAAPGEGIHWLEPSSEPASKDYFCRWLRFHPVHDEAGHDRCNSAWASRHARDVAAVNASLSAAVEFTLHVRSFLT